MFCDTMNYCRLLTNKHNEMAAINAATPVNIIPSVCTKYQQGRSLKLFNIHLLLEIQHYFSKPQILPAEITYSNNNYRLPPTARSAVNRANSKLNCFALSRGF